MSDDELEKKVKETIETILHDPDPGPNQELRFARINLMTRLLDTPGNRAI